MPRQKRETEQGRIGGHCKIRKRGCSSSSSSSLVKNYRFKRAILIRKRGGSSTPVPMWRMGSRLPPATAPPNSELPKPPPQPSRGGGVGLVGGYGKEMPLSARKLAATLWEINEVPSPRAKKDLEEMRSQKEKRRAEKVGRSSLPCSLPPHLSDPSHSPVSERMDRSRSGSHRRRTSAVCQKLQLADYNFEGLDSHGNASLMEIETLSQGRTCKGCITGIKSRLKDVSNGLTTCKELLKVLNHIWGMEEQHSSSISLISALRVELKRARSQVDQLIQEHHSHQNEISYLMKHFAEEKAAWKSKEQDRIRDAITAIAGELEVEKKLRRQTERLNKKLGKELADMKASLSEAVKELECEKRAREILEQVCDELVRGIGEDRARVEELKKESARVQEEVEKEREMLQLADVLREERVQMKLSEAKYQFEEKNAAVDKLRNELEAYLGTKAVKEKCDGSQSTDNHKEFQDYMGKNHLGLCENGEREKNEAEVANGEECEEDDSADSDLHSIELNMDNSSRSYKWSYAHGGDTQDDFNRVSVEEIKGRKSTPEKIQWGNISLGPETLDCMEWDFGAKNQENSDLFDGEGLSDLVLQNQGKDNDEEIRRYKSVKGLRDQILSGSKIASCQGFASPTRQWGQSLPSQDFGSDIFTSSMVQHGSSWHPSLVGNRDERRSSTHSRQ